MPTARCPLVDVHYSMPAADSFLAAGLDPGWLLWPSPAAIFIQTVATRVICADKKAVDPINRLSIQQAGC
jgi:hypothetical protein